MVTREELVAFTKLSDEDYYAHPALSNSLLSNLYKGPGYFHLVQQSLIERKEKGYQRTGNLFDSFITDELGFAQKYELMPEDTVAPKSPEQKKFCAALSEDWSIIKDLSAEELVPYVSEAYTRSYKKKLVVADAFDLYNLLKSWIRVTNSAQGRTLYTYAEHQQMMGMYQSLHRHPKASNIFKRKLGDGWECRNQQKILFPYKDFDLSEEAFVMKGMLDSLCINEHKRQIIVTDLKKTIAPLRQFLFELDRFNYDQQLYLYTEAARFFASIKYPRWLPGEWIVLTLFVVVNKEEPYETGVFSVPSNILHRGRLKIDQLLRRYTIHKNRNNWSMSAEALLNGGIEKFDEQLIQTLSPIPIIEPAF